MKALNIALGVSAVSVVAWGVWMIVDRKTSSSPAKATRRATPKRVLPTRAPAKVEKPMDWDSWLARTATIVAIGSGVTAIATRRRTK